MHPFDNTAPVCCDSIVVSTLHCGCKNPGSNPGHSIFFIPEAYRILCDIFSIPNVYSNELIILC